MPLSIKNIEVNSYAARISSSGKLNLNSQLNRFRRIPSIQGSAKQLYLDSREIRKPLRIHPRWSSLKKLGSATEPIDCRRLQRALSRVKNNPLYNSLYIKKYIPCVETIIQHKESLSKHLNCINPARETYSQRNYSKIEHQSVNYYQSMVMFRTNSHIYSGVDIMHLNSGEYQNLDQSPIIPMLQRVRQIITKLRGINYGITHLSDPILLTKDKLSQLASNAETRVNHCWLLIPNWIDCLRICKVFFLWISRYSQKQMKRQLLWRMPTTKILFYFIRSSMRRVHYGFDKAILAQIN